MALLDQSFKMNSPELNRIEKKHGTLTPCDPASDFASRFFFNIPGTPGSWELLLAFWLFLVPSLYLPSASCAIDPGQLLFILSV